jgi:hypothetical protein
MSCVGHLVSRFWACWRQHEAAPESNSMRFEPAQKHGGSKVRAAQPCCKSVSNMGHTSSVLDLFCSIGFEDLGAASHLSTFLDLGSRINFYLLQSHWLLDSISTNCTGWLMNRWACVTLAIAGNIWSLCPRLACGIPWKLAGGKLLHPSLQRVHATGHWTSCCAATAVHRARTTHTQLGGSSINPMCSWTNQKANR